MTRRTLGSGVALSQAPTKRAAAVPADRLRWRCDPELLGFASTDEVAPLEGTVGQERGLEAIALGLALEADGFNLYIAGPSGSGRTTTAQRMLTRVAGARSPAADWCYLHNFDEPSQPLAVKLATGRGPVLAHDLDELIVDCRREIPRVFEGEQYRQRRAKLTEEVQQQREALFDPVRALAQRVGFAIEFTPMGAATVPLLEPGKPLTPEAFELLPDVKKAEIRANGQALARQTEEVLLVVRRVERDAHERLRALDREAVSFAVGHLLDAFRAKYADMQPVIEHLDHIQADLVAHLDEFRATQPDPPPPPMPGMLTEHDFERYRANVVVTHDSEAGAPVVFEPNPTYYNLVGKIDYRASMGAMSTDFRLIRAGALHRANGGYLVLQARDVLLSPFAWEALKRALRERELRIENLGEQFSSFPTATLKPAPIPLDAKVVLIGDLQTYMLLHGLDPDFSRLFKVKAQFAQHMDRSPETIRAYAGFVSGQVRAHGLLPFASDAVGRVVEHGARLAEHQERLVTRFETIDDLLVEADHLARAAGVEHVGADHVEAAQAAQERRLNLYEEQLQREIEEGTIAIETHADVIAQVNALSVLEFGDYAFARPSRITARVGPGEEGVVDIEREVKLSGPTHSKGVLILSGYLLEQYARTIPLALSARLTFEQTYGEVDGDSASSAELYALLSALANIPIHQGIAVTGSVNQRGEIHAVGGVTTKIEGFFAVCKAQGLDGRQGVVIPASNARHLMLKQEVVDAVSAGKFHVWTVTTIDEGIELLTGVPAGERRPDGAFSAGSIHARVQQRLHELGARLVEFRRHTQNSTSTSKPNRNGHSNGAPARPRSRQRSAIQ
jgi:lon-related putative ATP-dependent protease